MTELFVAASRVRAVELRLARVRAAAELLGKHIHALGNALQIVELSSLELTRDTADPSEPLVDLREAAERAGEAFAAMLAVTKRAPRSIVGPAVAVAIRAAADLVAPALAAPLDVQVELGDGVCSHLDGDELDAMIAACLLDAATAPRMSVIVRERTIEGARWIELVRIDPAGELEFAAPSWLTVVETLAREVGGELSLSDGRDGRELVVAWPVAG